MEAQLLIDQLCEMIDEVRVVRSKRRTPAEKRKSKRRYMKKRSLYRRLAKRYRSRPKNKRLAKRRAKLRKRLKIKSGSRKRLYMDRDYTNILGEQMAKKVNLTEEISAINQYVSKSNKSNLLEAFESAKVLAENLITSIKEAKEKQTVWCSGPSFEGTYAAVIDGKKKEFKDRMELEEFLRDQKEKGLVPQWKQADEQLAFEMGESIELPSYVKDEIHDERDIYLMSLINEGEEKKEEKPKKEEPKTVDMSLILGDLEDVFKAAKKISMALKNESIDEEEAHGMLIRITEYLDKATKKFFKRGLK